MDIEKTNTEEQKALAFLVFEMEQRRLKEITSNRPLPRPKTTKIVVAAWIFLCVFLGFLISLATIFFFGITSQKWLVFSLSHVALFFLFLKKICTKSIECYQHYAKEETRRKCVCVPSCSEYSLAVLRKYNVFKALHKIRIRLFKTCGGRGFVQDEP